jgi:hypothetical protein
MDVAGGVTISSCYRRHRHQEFLRFLNDIDASLPRSFDVHLVMDNYGSLEKAMLDYLDERNKDPKPFVWTADADLILDKVRRLSNIFPTQDTVP